MKIPDYISKNVLSFGISIVYVSLAGVVACSVYPDDPLYGKWLVLGVPITLPANIISLGYRLSAGNQYFPVIIIQAAMFTPIYLLISSLMKKKKRSSAGN
jgi:hypothetical protein